MMAGEKDRSQSLVGHLRWALQPELHGRLCQHLCLAIDVVITLQARDRRSVAIVPSLVIGAARASIPSSDLEKAGIGGSNAVASLRCDVLPRGPSRYFLRSSSHRNQRLRPGRLIRNRAVIWYSEACHTEPRHTNALRAILSGCILTTCPAQFHVFLK